MLPQEQKYSRRQPTQVNGRREKKIKRKCKIGEGFKAGRHKEAAKQLSICESTKRKNKDIEKECMW